MSEEEKKTHPIIYLLSFYFYKFKIQNKRLSDVVYWVSVLLVLNNLSNWAEAMKIIEDTHNSVFLAEFSIFMKNSGKFLIFPDFFSMKRVNHHWLAITSLTLRNSINRMIEMVSKNVWHPVFLLLWWLN